MRILNKLESYAWLDDHDFRHRLRMSIRDIDSNVLPGGLIELPDLKHYLVFESETLKERSLLYQDLVSWMVSDSLLIFTNYCPYWGPSRRVFEGSLEEYLHEISPDYPIGAGGLSVQWNPREPGESNKMASIFDECVERNWEAYALQTKDGNCVWLADDVIEVRTDDSALFERLEAIIAA